MFCKLFSMQNVGKLWLAIRTKTVVPAHKQVHTVKLIVHNFSMCIKIQQVYIGPQIFKTQYDTLRYVKNTSA